MAIFKFEKNNKESVSVIASSRKEALEIGMTADREWMKDVTAHQVFIHLPNSHSDLK